MVEISAIVDFFFLRFQILLVAVHNKPQKCYGHDFSVRIQLGVTPSQQSKNCEKNENGTDAANGGNFDGLLTKSKAPNKKLEKFTIQKNYSSIKLAKQK